MVLRTLVNAKIRGPADVAILHASTGFTRRKNGKYANICPITISHIIHNKNMGKTMLMGARCTDICNGGCGEWRMC